jgi:hypothetical protein
VQASVSPLHHHLFLLFCFCFFSSTGIGMDFQRK